MKRQTRNEPVGLAAARRHPASTALTLAIAASLALGALMPAVADTLSRSANKTAKGLSPDQKVIHVLNRLGFGPRPGDVERVRRIGLDKYIEQQLYPERIPDSSVEARLASFPSLRMTIAEVQNKYPAPQLLARELGLRQGKGKANGASLPIVDNPEALDENQRQQYRQQVLAYYREHALKPPQALLQELQGQKLIRAIYSERQLQEVMTDFWFNHFNIFWAKNLDRALTTSYEMEVIRPHTMGKFKDMLMATAKSPAMLVYLDNFQSMSPDAKLPMRRGMGQGQLRRGPLGGFQKEQMQQPQPVPQFANRTPGINENYAREIMELHTMGVEGGYTQKDVQEVARCFTGWTVDRPRQSAGFVFRQWMHDNGEKTVLGNKIPAGGGIKDGERVIDILAHHPATAKFISTKLVRRFVSDAPPQSLVDRVASVYQKTGGDIREMLRTIFAAPEFYSKEAYRAKIKSPLELAVSAVRALGGEVTFAQQTAQFIAKMGQPLYLYQAPTGYPDRADQWVNTGSLLERLNFGLALSTNKLRGASVDVKQVAAGADSSDKQQVLERAIAALLNGDVSPQTRSVLDRQLKEGVAVKGELGDVARIPSVAGEDSMGGNSMQLLNEADSVGRSQRAGKPERLERRLGVRQGGGPQSVMSADDLEIARVFGLVLGSPEFQRR
ncbi:MAG TPA: DUF1800 domain-containing protein [Blastocatellia bacterium]|nr:DUF1800 domain-containing protein [Blastocatellia bacterium]